MIIDSPPPYQDLNRPSASSRDEKSSSPLSSINQNPIPFRTVTSSPSSSSSPPLDDSINPPPFQEAVHSDSQSKYLKFRIKACRRVIFKLGAIFSVLLAFISFINLEIVQSLFNSAVVYLDSFLPTFLSTPISSITSFTLKPIFQSLLGPRIATTSYTFLLILIALKGKAAMKEAMRLKKVLEEHRFREWERRVRELQLQLQQQQQQQQTEIQSDSIAGGMLSYEEEQLVAQVEARRAAS